MTDAEMPRDLFAAVSDPTRAATLRELVRAYRADPTDPWLSYADLRRAVGVDDAGNFNYHLRRLGALVVKDSPGYRISRHGMTVAAIAASGLLDPDWNWGPIEVPGTCPFCADPVCLEYDGESLELRCGDDEHAMALPGSPALVSGAEDPTDVCERVAVSVHGELASLRHGVCPTCSGAADGTLRREPASPDHWHLHADCTRCGLQYGYPVGVTLLCHPTVERFLRDRGVAPRTTPFWTLQWTAPGTPTVSDTRPLRLRTPVRADGDTLTVVLDGAGGLLTAEVGED